MSGFRGKFERELRDKLTQRSNAKMSEEACLMKMFKYFDVSGNQCVDFGEFQKTMEKTGMYYPEEQLRPLFNSYDRDGSGELDYKEFAAAIFPGSSNKGQMQKKPQIAPQTAEALIKAFR
jgi:Ca2+-binding EF-hand superfamily protein